MKYFGLTGLFAGGLGFAFTPARANTYYSGPASDHFDGLQFRNHTGTKPKSFRELLRWQLSTRSEPWPASFESPFQDRPPARVAADACRISFIGHASYLIQIAGLNILFDPVYAERAGPFGLLGPKRANAPGIALADLPPIDVILITHNHYDHLDLDTIGRLWQRSRPRPRLITPLGNDTIVRGSVKDINATAVDWNDSLEIGNDVRIDAVETQHWSARGTRDRMHALWASFVIRSPRHTLYFVGDTGFGDGSIFQQIAKRYPAIDLAALPIGAYEPRWFMRDQHMDPAEAVEALRIVGARRAIGHHWGTFKLTNEGVAAPRDALRAALQSTGTDEQRFLALQPGQVVAIA